MNAAAFPVICLSPDGRVAAKNRAAYTYLPKIRMKSSLFPKASFSKSGNAMLGDATLTFRYAVCVPIVSHGETVRILLFLPSAQSGEFFDGDENCDAERIIEMIKSGRGTAEPRRLYSEIAEAFSALDRESTSYSSATDVTKTAEILNKRLSSGFRALGYRATVNVTDSVKNQRYFKLNFYAFVYSVLTAAYVAMRLSQSGAADVTIDYDGESEHVIVTSTSRTAAKMPTGARCAEDAVAELVPEYAIEMMADKALSPDHTPKKCSIKGGLFTLSIPVKADTRHAEMRSRASLYTLDDIVGGIFDGFAIDAKKHFPRRKKETK